MRQIASKKPAIAVVAAMGTALLAPITASATDDREYRYEVEVTIEIDKRAYVEEAGYDVTFVEVLEDTRCPVDVECALPGNARILIRFVPGMGPFYDLELDTLESLQNEAFLSDGTGARLVALEPPRTEGADPDPESYQATLVFFAQAE